MLLIDLNEIIFILILNLHRMKLPIQLKAEDRMSRIRLNYSDVSYRTPGTSGYLRPVIGLSDFQ